jgi:hypothetical protein
MPAPCSFSAICRFLANSAAPGEPHTRIQHTPSPQGCPHPSGVSPSSPTKYPSPGTVRIQALVGAWLAGRPEMDVMRRRGLRRACHGLDRGEGLAVVQTSLGRDRYGRRPVLCLPVGSLELPLRWPSATVAASAAGSAQGCRKAASPSAAHRQSRSSLAIQVSGLRGGPSSATGAPRSGSARCPVPA